MAALATSALMRSGRRTALTPVGRSVCPAQPTAEWALVALVRTVIDGHYPG
jgi:hypothetical protein